MGSSEDGKPLDEMEELYFDMDVSISMSQDALRGIQSMSTSSESPDFEFTMSSVEEEYEAADQLFFKGQLLPLLLPPRLQMVQNLLASEQSESRRSQAQEEKASCASSNSDVSNLCPDAFSCGSQANPEQVKSSNLISGSQSSSTFWDSCDKDSAESSFRDSNGSSQDSCFSSKDTGTREGCAGGLVDNVTSAEGKGQEKAQTSWLKIAFPWKSIFGSRKAPKSKIPDKSREKSAPASRNTESCISLQNSSLRALAMAPLTAEPYNWERTHHADARRHTIPLPCYSSRIYRALAAGEGAQKPADFWHRYLNPLKRLRSKVSDRGEQILTEEESIAAKTLSAYFVGESPFAKKPSCTSFLPASLKVPSFARRDSPPTSRLSSSRSSPNHSGVLSPVDYARMADIQSAVQGAIAHCKQSQAGGKLDSQEDIH